MNNDLEQNQKKPTFEEWLSTRTDTIESDCGCVSTETFYHWLKVAYGANPQPAHKEQDGWKLVPIEPTQEMVDACFEATCAGGIQKGYRAMLAAAPKPESE